MQNDPPGTALGASVMSRIFLLHYCFVLVTYVILYCFLTLWHVNSHLNDFSVGSQQYPEIVNSFPKAFPTSPLTGDTLRLECVAYGR